MADLAEGDLASLTLRWLQEAKRCAAARPRKAHRLILPSPQARDGRRCAPELGSGCRLRAQSEQARADRSTNHFPAIAARSIAAHRPARRRNGATRRLHAGRRAARRGDKGRGVRPHGGARLSAGPAPPAFRRVAPRAPRQQGAARIPRPMVARCDFSWRGSAQHSSETTTLRREAGVALLAERRVAAKLAAEVRNAAFWRWRTSVLGTARRDLVSGAQRAAPRRGSGR
jgi:hypothetical protein